jgi:hypothetical protein
MPATWQAAIRVSRLSCIRSPCIVGGNRAHVPRPALPRRNASNTPTTVSFVRLHKFHLVTFLKAHTRSQKICATPLQRTSASGRSTRHLFIEGVLRALIVERGPKTRDRPWVIPRCRPALRQKLNSFACTTPSRAVSWPSGEIGWSTWVRADRRAAGRIAAEMEGRNVDLALAQQRRRARAGRAGHRTGVFFGSHGEPDHRMVVAGALMLDLSHLHAALAGDGSLRKGLTRSGLNGKLVLTAIWRYTAGPGAFRLTA